MHCLTPDLLTPVLLPLRFNESGVRTTGRLNFSIISPTHHLPIVGNQPLLLTMNECKKKVKSVNEKVWTCTGTGTKIQESENVGWKSFGLHGRGLLPLDVQLAKEEFGLRDPVGGLLNKHQLSMQHQHQKSKWQYRDHLQVGQLATPTPPSPSKIKFSLFSWVVLMIKNVWLSSWSFITLKLHTCWNSFHKKCTNLVN